MIVVFIVAGTVINKKLNSYQPKSILEEVMHRKNKKQTQKELWITLGTLTLVVVIQNVYNIWDYVKIRKTERTCNDLTNSWAAN